MREKAMPRKVKNILHSIDCAIEGPNTEAAVLDKCSEFGYEVVDEDIGRKTPEGSYIHSVMVQDQEGRVCYLHFNHPGPEYAKRNGEWYWYIL